MAASARDIIDGLREEIRRIERRAPRRPDSISSGWKEVDALLPGGGFPRGALSEIAGGPGSGKTTLALSVLAAAAGAEGLAAFVDARRELYPPAAAAFGVDLDRLLIVRPSPPAGVRRAGEEVRVALWTGEALLGSGAFEAVALDIPLHAAARGRTSAARLEAMLRRLRAAAEKGGPVVLWLATQEAVRVPAAVRLELSTDGEGARVRRAFACGTDAAPACAGSVARVGAAPSPIAGGASYTLLPRVSHAA
jgi:protein ImuA